VFFLWTAFWVPGQVWHDGYAVSGLVQDKFMEKSEKQPLLHPNRALNGFLERKRAIEEKQQM